MTAYAALNVNPSSKVFSRSRSKLRQVASRVSSGMAAHWLQYVDSLLEGLTPLPPFILVLFSSPPPTPFICPSLCSAAASEASHTHSSIISLLLVSVGAGGKKRKPELIRGRKPIQRQKKAISQI